MAFAACSTVTDPAGVVAEALEDALTFDSVPGAADSLDGVDGEALDGVDGDALDDGKSAVAELGGTSAADGGTEPTDAVWDALADGEADGAGDCCVAGLCEAAVDVTEGSSEAGGAMARGAGDSTFVTVGLGVAVGDTGTTGATAVTTGSVVVWVTGGADGSTA